MIDIAKLAEQCIDREADPPDDSCDYYAFYPNELQAFADTCRADALREAAGIVQNQYIAMSAMFPLCADTLDHCENAILAAISDKPQGDLCEWREIGRGISYMRFKTMCEAMYDYTRLPDKCEKCGKPIKVKE